MSNAWNTRFDVIGPFLVEFIAAEKSYAGIYQSNLQTLRLPMVMPNLPSVADMQAAAAAATSAVSLAASSAATSAVATLSGFPLPPPRK